MSRSVPGPSSAAEQLEYVGSTDVPYALEGHIPVYLCRKAKFGSLDRIWPRLKSWG
jgi:hypothetical protein